MSTASGPGTPRLPRPAVQTGVWAAFGLAAAWWMLVERGLGSPGVHGPALVALFLASMVTSRLDVPAVRSLRRRAHNERVSLHEASLVLLLVVLPPGWAWLVTVGGFGLSSIGKARGLKYVFNLGLWATTAALAVGTHAAISADPGPILGAREVAAVAVAVLVHLACNYLAVQLVMAAATGSSVRIRMASTGPVLAWTWVGNLLLGLTAAGLWLHTPWLALLALGLAVVLRSAYEQTVEARRVLDAVRLDRDRLDLVTESSPLGVVLLDHDGTVSVWNAAMAELTGISDEEALGRHVDTVLMGRVELRAATGTGAESLASATRTGVAPPPSELVLRRRDGDERVVAVSHSLQHDELGGVARVVVQLRDLTAQREVSRLQDDFLARVTHELRTPLTSIIGFGRTLLHRGEELPSSTRDDLVHRLVAAGEDLEHLVDDLLLVASSGRRRSGRTTRTLREQALAPLVEAAVARERGDHPGRDVQVRHSGEAVAVVEEAWLGTVVRHLVCNGLTYSHDLAPVTVEVGDAPDGAFVRVVDRGRGIPPSKLRTVFERFSRVEEPLRMETRGAGLGLFIVDRLVARMGGHVEVESVVGEGSTFTVRLPGTPPDLPPAAPSPRVASSGATAR